MKILGRYKGKLGDIAIWESEKTRDRFYLEGEIFQSQSSAAGESRLPYVKMMEAFLGDAKNVLLLGCGGGNLATMLTRSGKNVTETYLKTAFDATLAGKKVEKTSANAFGCAIKRTTD